MSAAAMSIRVRRLWALALAVAVVAAGFVVASFQRASAASDGKVWVCKYVQTPGGLEVFKDGKNPIAVSVNATEGQWFKDGQYLSYVVGPVTDKAKPPTCGPMEPPATEPPTKTPTPDTDESTPATGSSSPGATKPGATKPGGKVPSAAATGHATPWYAQGPFVLLAGGLLLALGALGLRTTGLRGGTRR